MCLWCNQPAHNGVKYFLKEDLSKILSTDESTPLKYGFCKKLLRYKCLTFYPHFLTGFALCFLQNPYFVFYSLDELKSKTKIERQKPIFLLLYTLKKGGQENFFSTSKKMFSCPPYPNFHLHQQKYFGI